MKTKPTKTKSTKIPTYCQIDCLLWVTCNEVEIVKNILCNLVLFDSRTVTVMRFLGKWFKKIKIKMKKITHLNISRWGKKTNSISLQPFFPQKNTQVRENDPISQVWRNQLPWLRLS